MKALHGIVFIIGFPGLFAGCTSGISELDERAVVAAVACRDVTDSTKRLACMDEAAGKLAQTSIIRENLDGTREPYIEDTEIAVVADAGAADVNGTFGSERIPSVRRARDNNRRNSIASRIVEIVVDPFNKLTVTLENGQVWRQLSSDDRIIRFPQKSDTYTVEIKRGLVGNYMMKIVERDSVIRVHRIE